MTRKAGAPRCVICGHRADQGSCGRNHGPLRSLHGLGPLTPARGLPPLDLVSGITEVVRSVFTIVLGRSFVGTLRGPVAVNAIAFLALSAGFWFGLLPAFEGAFEDERNPALWAVASWVLLAPPLLELLAGPAQGSLRAVTERIMLGDETAAAAPLAAMSRLSHRAAVVVLAAILLPFGLAIVQIPWAGLPLVFVLGAALMAFVWFDTAISQSGYDPAERAALLWRNRWRALGVGAGLQLASAVPFVNLLLLPSLAAVSTTSAFVRFDKQPVGTPGAAQ